MRMPQAKLLKLIDHMRAQVAAEGSFQGRLEYDAALEGLEAGEFEVSCAFRVGQEDGQGGMVIVETTVDPATPPPATGPEFYIVDLRAHWNKNRWVSLWRPNDAGYCWPLPWAGRYEQATVLGNLDYYVKRAHDTGDLERFPVACCVVEALARPAPPRSGIDGDVGPVVANTAAMRALLRAAAHLPPRPGADTTRPAADGEQGHAPL